MDIEFINVNKSFGDKKILADFNLMIPQGEVLCIMGESGGGKTTIANLLAGILRPDSGVINIQPDVRISMVFQEERLLPWFSALDNLMFICGNGKETENSFKENVLRLAQDLSLDDSLDKNILSMSGGMQRRLSILRALAAPFDLLILDEPFKGLNESLKQRVMDTVIREASGKTIVLVTHSSDEPEYFAKFLPVTIHYT